MATKDMRGGNYAAELQPKEIYKDRRRRLLERVGDGMVVMWGAGDDRGYGALEQRADHLASVGEQAFPNRNPVAAVGKVHGDLGPAGIMG